MDLGMYSRKTPLCQIECSFTIHPKNGDKFKVFDNSLESENVALRREKVLLQEAIRMQKTHPESQVKPETWAALKVVLENLNGPVFEQVKPPVT